MFIVKESLVDSFTKRQQMNKHDCSVAVSWCVLTYFGFDISYRELYSFIKPPTDPNEGVSGEEIMDLLQKFGIKTKSEKSNIAKLRYYTEKECPVIASIQHKKERNKEWKNTVDYGHYIVVLKVDDDRVKFMDPDYGTIRSLSIEEFKQRWHDGDEEIIYENPAIICYYKDSDN